MYLQYLSVNFLPMLSDKASWTSLKVYINPWFKQFKLKSDICQLCLSVSSFNTALWAKSKTRLLFFLYIAIEKPWASKLCGYIRVCRLRIHLIKNQNNRPLYLVFDFETNKASISCMIGGNWCFESGDKIETTFAGVKTKNHTVSINISNTGLIKVSVVCLF